MTDRVFGHRITTLFGKLILGMVSKPDQCVIEEESHIGSLAITVLPDMVDYQILCGRGGNRIRALKFLAAQAGEQSNLKVTLDLEDSFRGKPGRIDDFMQNPEFDVDGAIGFIKDICELCFPLEPDISYERQCDKLIVTVRPRLANDSNSVAISALREAFYTYGYRQGMLIEIKANESSNHAMGTGKVLGQ